MSFEIPIIIDEHILNEIPQLSKYAKFLCFFLEENQTKAVIIKSKWTIFIKKWSTTLGDGDVAQAFFSVYKGLIRPYRKIDFENEKEDVNPIKETIKIANRDYDIVEYLIVGTPSDYKGFGLKINEENIVDLKSFYKTMEVKNTQIFQDFKKSYVS